jgi:uncharacterized protein (TIGR00369 family)
VTETAEGADAPQAADLGRAWFEHSPFIRQLGMQLVSMEPDEVEVELPFKEELATAGDVVHGGAISALLDTAAALAAWSGHDISAGTRWGTVGISVSFLSSGRGQALRAKARVTKRGKSVCFCQVDVSDESGAAVATALVTYRLG